MKEEKKNLISIFLMNNLKKKLDTFLTTKKKWKKSVIAYMKKFIKNSLKAAKMIIKIIKNYTHTKKILKKNAKKLIK